MWKIIKRTLAVFAVLLASLGFASPAQAVCPVPPLSCPFPSSLDDAFCVYDDDYYNNLIDFWYPAEPRNSCVRIEQGPQYLANSIYNNTAYTWRLFRTSTCGGSHMAIAGYTSIPVLPSGWRNAVVAFSRTSTATTC